MRGLDTLVATLRTRAISPYVAGGQDVSIWKIIYVKAETVTDWLNGLDVEALQVIYDPEKVTYRQLLEFFYKMHDPTTLNRQGPDTGTQYRSAIFFHNGEQERIAKDITEKVEKEWWKKKLTTEIIPAGEWYDAETYHQLYLDKSKIILHYEYFMDNMLTFVDPGGYECPSHFLRKFPPLSE